MNMRHIGITVDEIDPGCFAWLLMEGTGQRDAREVATAQAPLPSYGDAWEAGYAVLQRRVEADPSLVPSPL
ncbi:MAG: hypothetical protein H7332_15290 [Bdellovibrionales bacterium]|nr:hypothetical protein [Ramlibacter sp.]